MSDEKRPGDGETVREKTERLKAARLQADRERDARIERDTRKSAARRKALAGPSIKGPAR
ncbi:hypothetical protein [Aureimonas sp. AU22]|jgi:hypothetical protein|uniref:hypothetical protein n=1 Tax=Aureimonas sp. AU22 TaxID=1638162 RepID=UPI0007857FE0|nr:hypothetical protein [Aureimonas sp. AU22]